MPKDCAVKEVHATKLDYLGKKYSSLGCFPETVFSCYWD